MSRIAAGGDLPLFSYPNAPGYRRRETSRAAARAVTSKAASLRERVYGAFVEAGAAGLTADQAAGRLGADKHSVRSRVTELSLETPPRLKLTEERRKNDSGCSAQVWRAA